MTRRRFPPFIFCLFLVTSAIGTWVAFAHSPERHALSSPPEQSAGKGTLAISAAPTSELLRPPPSLQANRLGNVAGSGFVLSPESAAQLAEQIELNGLAAQAGLSLTSSQLRTFAEVTSTYQAIREAFELEIATVGVSAGGGRRLEIPLYSDAGDALRSSFYNALRNGLGDSVAAEIASKMNSQLESRFAGFGVAEQTIEERSGATSTGGELVLTRSVVYWNPFGAADRPITRRETCFPAQDGGDGTHWARVQALLGIKSSASM